MPLRFLVSPVYLNGIAHGLEGVEREADREQYGQVFQFKGMVQQVGKLDKIVIQEIEILKKRQYPDIRDQAYDQK